MHMMVHVQTHVAGCGQLQSTGTIGVGDVQVAWLPYWGDGSGSASLSRTSKRVGTPPETHVGIPTRGPHRHEDMGQSAAFVTSDARSLYRLQDC